MATKAARWSSSRHGRRLAADVELAPVYHQAMLLLLLPHVAGAALPGASGVSVARHRRDYAETTQAKLQRDRASDFVFRRFQRPAAIKAAFDDCRSAASFKLHESKDGRRGRVCSTKLGGDWVLAESEQVAPSCTTEEVVRAYLDPIHNDRWNADKVAKVILSRKKMPDGSAYYQQDLVLRSIRVLRGKTGPMRYSQTIAVDKIGSGNYCAFVQLDPQQASSARKPFESLSVYVGLQQQGEDVKIYAAGIMQVNRKVVPNLVVFDASGIAGDHAGRGTLWLSGHFEEKQAQDRRAAAAAREWPGARAFERTRDRVSALTQRAGQLHAQRRAG